MCVSTVVASRRREGGATAAEESEPGEENGTAIERNRRIKTWIGTFDLFKKCERKYKFDKFVIRVKSL